MIIYQHQKVIYLYRHLKLSTLNLNGWIEFTLLFTVLLTLCRFKLHNTKIDHSKYYYNLTFKRGGGHSDDDHAGLCGTGTFQYYIYSDFGD